MGSRAPGGPLAWPFSPSPAPDPQGTLGFLRAQSGNCSGVRSLLPCSCTSARCLSSSRPQHNDVHSTLSSLRILTLRFVY